MAYEVVPSILGTKESLGSHRCFAVHLSFDLPVEIDDVNPQLQAFCLGLRCCFENSGSKALAR